MRRTRLFLALPAAALVALVLALIWPSGQMISRDIGCAEVNPARGREICKAISDSMAWSWTGHAIISPGWRVTWDGLHRVFCREKINAADIAVLGELKRDTDWRLQAAADDLIRLISNRSGKGSEDESSIFNPKNTEYILKDGCRGDE